MLTSRSAATGATNDHLILSEDNRRRGQMLTWTDQHLFHWEAFNMERKDRKKKFLKLPPFSRRTP